MNVSELQNIIANLMTAVPVSIDLISEGRLLKRGNPYPNAKKHVTISGLVGASYENAVNNQLGREDKDLDFDSQRPVWMERLGRNLGTNKAHDRVYVPVKVQSASKPVYVSDGVDVTSEVQGWIPKKSAPKTQVNLDIKVIWRTPALDNISKVRMLGAEYSIEC